MEFDEFVDVGICEVYERMLAAYRLMDVGSSAGESYELKNDCGPYICRAIASVVRYDKLDGSYDVDSDSMLRLFEGWFGRPLFSNLYGIEGCFTHEEMVNFIRLGATTVGAELDGHNKWDASSDGKWMLAAHLSLRERFWSRIGMLVDVMGRMGEFEFEVLVEGAEMSISITISELRDYMIEQIRRQNFWPSFICYAVEGVVKNKLELVLLGAVVNDAVIVALSDWFGVPLSSGVLGIDENFSYEQLFEWMKHGHRVVADVDIGLPTRYEGYDCVGRMLCRIGMLTWLMDVNGIPGDAEIVISTEE